jgi:hypothetical protein
MTWTGEVDRKGRIDIDLPLGVEPSVVDTLSLLGKTLDPGDMDLTVGVYGKSNGQFDVALTEQQAPTPVPVRLVGALECACAAPADKGERGDKEDEQDLTEARSGEHAHSVRAL